MADLKYQRVLIKLSGEAISGAGGQCVDLPATKAIAEEITQVAAMGVGVGVVVGAGNLVRGRNFAGEECVEPTTADYMGMLGTIMNALVLRDVLESLNQPASVFSAIDMPLVCEGYFRPLVMERLKAGHVLIFGGGTSHPGVTTDMCAAIRGRDIDADVLLKATTVDGVYSADPNKNPNATKFDTLSFEEVLQRRLGVMDLPAMAFCQDHGLPVMVFKMSDKGNLARAVCGEEIGTMVTE